MKLLRYAGLGLIAAVLVAAAYWNQADQPPGMRMVAAADQFLGSLTAEQKKKAIFAFDDAERTNWHFVPLQDKDKKPTRNGLGIFEMNADQRKRALALLESGLSKDGYAKATTIMSLESILRDLEKGGSMVRDPDWYFVAVFGTPGAKGKWGWRVEGHHLSLNFTVEDGKVISTTPAFFGSNPASVKQGDNKPPLRPLAAAEDLAKDLYQALDDEQKKLARKEDHHPEVKGKTKLPDIGEPAGLAASKLNNKQKAILEKLLADYCSRMPDEVAAAELKAIRDAGIDKVHIHYGIKKGLATGEPYTYRIQGPTFVVEFLNIQADSSGNPANHIHSCWRSLKNDFGLAGK